MASNYCITQCNTKTNDSCSKLILLIFHSMFSSASMKSEVKAVNVLFPLVKEIFKQLNDTGFISMSSEV